MVELSFVARSPLGGVEKHFEGLSICEITDRAITSIGVPMNGEKELSNALADAFNIQLPKTGQFTKSEMSNSQLLGLQDGHLFLVHDANASVLVTNNMEGVGYFTDQSDSWAMLSVSGSKSRELLAKLCSVNLHRDKFPQGKVVRTRMDHMSVIIFRSSGEGFVLMTFRSSAASLLRALEFAAGTTLSDAWKR